MLSGESRWQTKLEIKVHSRGGSPLEERRRGVEAFGACPLPLFSSVQYRAWYLLPRHFAKYVFRVRLPSFFPRNLQGRRGREPSPATAGRDRKFCCLLLILLRLRSPPSPHSFFIQPFLFLLPGTIQFGVILEKHFCSVSLFYPFLPFFVFPPFPARPVIPLGGQKGTTSCWGREEGAPLAAAA